MAIGAWVGGTLSESVGGSTTPGIPAGVSEGELLVMVDRVVHTTRTLGAATTGTPAGWVEKDSYLSTGSGKSRTTLYYRRWTSGVGAPTVTYSGGGSAAHTSRIYRVPGAKLTGDPTDFVTGGTWATSGSAGPIPGGVTSVDGGAVLVAAQREDASSASPSSAATLTGDGLSWVELTDVDFSTGDDSWSVTDYALVPTAQTITAKTFTMTASPGNYPGSGVMWALLPEPTFVVHTAAAAFAGTGALAVAAVAGLRGAATFAGSGVLTVTARQGHAAQATFAGAGALTATARRVQPASATFAGAGGLTATAVRVRPASAAFSGAGSMLANAGELGAATFTGAGALTVGALRQTHAASAAFAGSGALTSAARSTQRIATTLAGAGQMLVDARRVHPTQATFAGSGQMLADARRVHPGLVTLAGAGQMLVAGVRSRPGAAAFAGTGRLTASARLARPGLNVSLWAVTGGTLTPLPGFAKLDVSRERNAPGSVQVDYPAGAPGFDLLRNAVTQDRPVEVEVWFGGSRDGALRGQLTQTSGEDVDARAVWSFSGQWLEQLLAGAVVHPQPLPADKGELLFNAATAGTVVATVLNQAQARGALSGFTRDWTTAVDSTGQAWPNSITGLKYSPKTTLLAILQDLVEKDFCEFEVTRDRVLRLWATGRRGVDRSTGNDPALFRFGRVKSWPLRHDTRGKVSAVLAVGADGMYATATDATAAAELGGRVETSVDAGNIADQGALQAYAQAALNVLKRGMREVRHPLTFGPGDPVPRSGWDLADKVVSERAGGMRDAVDVQQWTLAVTRGEPASGEVLLNDLIASRLQRLQRQLERIGSGGAVIGTSQPADTGPDTLAPAAPTGLTASSIAYQDDQHSQTLAAVTLGWAPVTTNAGGPATERSQAAQFILTRMQSGLSIAEDWTWVGAPPVVGAQNDFLLADFEASGSTDAQAWLAGYVAANSAGATATDDVAGYKVQLAYLGLSQVGGLPYANPVDEVISYNDVTPSSGISETSFTFGSVEADASIGLRVAAFDSSGNQSAWSVPLAHTTEGDNIPPPVPSAPSARNFLRQLIVEWNGLGSAGEVMPRDFDHVEAHASMASNFTATAATVFDRMYGEGGVVYDPGAYVGEVFFKLVAVDRSGNRSVASVQASATPSRAIADDIGDQIIGAAKLADGAVLGPKIGAEAVSTPHLSVATFSDNMLPNGGFEDISLTTALPASWLVATTSGGTNTFTRATSVAADVFSGAAAAQVAMSAASGRIDLTSDTIPTKPGDNWYFELSAKASRAVAGLSVYLGVGAADSTTSYPAGYSFPFLASLTPLTTAYPGAPLGLNYTVPATVGAGVVPRYLRLYLRFGDVVGDAAAVTFLVDEVRARKVVGTAEIQDAAISRAKIGLLAVGDGQFESASVGKLLTGTMTATVTNSGLFRTASTGNRVEFDSAGLRLYQGTTVVGRWQTSDASMLMTGTYMSSLAGERINILTDGTMRFYPPSGTNYAQIRNDGNQVTFRGPSDVNGRSGYIGFNAIGAGLAFAADSEIPSNLRSEIVLFERRARITAPLVDFQLNGKLENPNGGVRRVVFSQTSENGANLPITAVSYRAASSGHGGFEGNDAGLKFIDGHLEVVDGPMNAFRAIFASAFSVASSETVKEDVRDVRAELDPGAVIRGARSKRYTYTWERWRTPVATEDDPTPDPVEVEPPVHFGPIAEDLPPVLQVPISNPTGAPGETLGVSLGDQIGVLWAWAGQLEDQQTRSVTGRVVVTSGQLRPGDTLRVTVEWDETPLAVPTDVTALALPAMPTATGRVSARVDPASVTTTGCEVVVAVSGVIPVTVTAALPIGVEVIGRYLYRPPYVPEDDE